MTIKPATDLAVLLQRFFTQRLMSQRQASPHTIASYRDTFRLLLTFVRERLQKPPSQLALEEIDAPLVGAFLDSLEKSRGNSARSRNLRLTAIRSFFHYVAYEAPTHSAQIQRVLAMPSKRHVRRQVTFLTRPEVDALLAAPDRNTWCGRRDHAVLLLAVQTGLRVSEMTNLKRQDVSFATGAHVRCVGKGRKERCTPLTRKTVAVLRAWMRDSAQKQTDILFPSLRGGRLTADAVQFLLGKHTAVARKTCPSLQRKHVTPHVLRHTMAMELLQAGVDRALIALWLGHESVETTQVYLDANLALKEKILATTTPVAGHPSRFRPDDRLLAFLNAL